MPSHQKQDPPQQQQKQPDQELPENIKFITDSSIIYNNSNYETRELEFLDEMGKTGWTVTVTRLKPGSQTRGHSHPELIEFYLIQRGEGWVLLKNRAYAVRPQMCIMNHVDSWIKLINTSATTDLVFMTFLNGRYKRPDVSRK